MRKISQEGLALIKQWEGLRLDLTQYTKNTIKSIVCL
ncbi:GH24 family phage-related lysozyme (muramidase) [Bartonella japonica]|uniref:GH24 family phage-related lysozyme (Muramidase) n=1 Tax=Bartonella japonica TaxID=357761 RepID=A0ABV2FQJ6_9HYPH